MGIQLEIDMIVCNPRRQIAKGAKAAGHAEMDEERIFAQAEQKIFAAPIDAIDPTAGNARRQVGGNRPTQPGVVHPHDTNARPGGVGRDTAACGLDFR